MSNLLAGIYSDCDNCWLACDKLAIIWSRFDGDDRAAPKSYAAFPGAEIEEAEVPLHRRGGLAIARLALELFEVFALDLLEIDMQ
jgi:hypothetical protein